MHPEINTQLHSLVAEVPRMFCSIAYSAQPQRSLHESES